MITLRFIPTVTDRLHAEWLYQARTRSRVSRFLDVAFLCASAFYLLQYALSRSFAWLALLWAAAVAFFACEVAGHSLLAVASTALRFRLDPRLRQEFFLSADASGFTIAQSTSSIHFTWSHFKWAFQTPAFFILAFPPRQFMTVPCRAFQSEADRAAFSQLLAAVLPAPPPGRWPEA